MRETHKICPLCQSELFVPAQFGLLRCSTCELIVDQAVWRSGANEELNQASFGDSYEPVGSFWIHAFEWLNNRRTMGRLGHAASGARLLEIGVGSGSFLRTAKSRGLVPLGCDLSEAICRRVERTAQVPMHCGALDTLPGDQQFDIVVMNHVLEHVTDPIGMLQAVRRRLKPTGMLHLAVPNVAAWEARLPGWNSYEPYHLLYFDPGTIGRAVKQAGFEIRGVSTHESFSGWFLAALRTALRTRSAPPSGVSAQAAASTSSLVQHAYRLAMVAFGVVTLPLRILQAALKRGDEVIVIASPALDE